jgi:FixJ family two-component response regulator
MEELHLSEEVAVCRVDEDPAELRRLKEIARELGLSTRTIEDRRAKLMRKMDVASLAELVQVVMTH